MNQVIHKTLHTLLEMIVMQQKMRLLYNFEVDRVHIGFFP